MKIAITADLQFSTQAKLSHAVEDGISSRLSDQVACFHWIVNTALVEGCTRLVALGDIFDARNVIPVAVIDQACRCFDYARSKFVPLRGEVHVLVGNHDSLLRSPQVNSLRALSGLATIWEAAGTSESFAFVPWIEDPDDYRAAIGEVAEDAGAKYLFSHVMVEGAVPADVGKPQRDLRPKRWKRILLGDIHEPLAFGNIQYAGAPMQHHFGDADGRRGFWILDTTADTLEFFENDVSPRFHIITGATIDDVQEGDFVRVRAVDPDVAERVAAEAAKVTAWVENETIRLADEEEPRLDMRGDSSYEERLRRYVEHCGHDDPALVKTGLDLIEGVGE